MKQRIWEIDYFRGVAILLMVVFHFIVDLKDFFGFSIEYMSGFWYYEGKLSAVLFILLAGVSSGLNPKSSRHGMKVLAAAALVTAVTFAVNSETYVRFGILHLLGIAILLGPLLSKLPAALLILASSCLVWAQVWADRMTDDSGLLLPFGITPSVFVTVDYYPLIPWLSVFIAGQVLGGSIYSQRESRLRQPKGTSIICRLGRHSLLIYLVHQPVMLAVLYIVLR